MAVVTLENVKVVRESSLVLDIEYLEIPDAELLVVLGPSGSGKTTLLRVVAGLEEPSSGRVLFDGQDMSDVRTADRGVAMVFQESTLYPHLDVRGNVGFPLRLSGTHRDEIDRRVEAEARVMAIEHLLSRRPGELGAGHQQLVQAARALVRVPAVFLMDEPLARMDAQLRGQVRQEFRLLQMGYGVTTLFVTNDRDEAMVMADRMAVLDGGVIQQLGLPMDLYRHPQSRFVGGFVGSMGFATGSLTRDSSGYWVAFGRFKLRAWTPSLSEASSTGVVVGIRPEEVAIDASGTPVRVGRSYTVGSYGFAQIEVADNTWIEMRQENEPPTTGSEVRVRLRRVHVFDSRTGKVLGVVEDGGG